MGLRIDQFPTSVASAAADLVPVMQSGVTRQVPLSQLSALFSQLASFVQSGTGATSTTLQARGRLTILAQDYGLVGDGTTDNAAAFAVLFNALSSGDTVFFPKGTYRTTSPIPIKSGVTLAGNGPGNTIIEHLKQAVATSIDDGNAAMTVSFVGLTIRRSGDGTALSGAAGSNRWTIRIQNASSVFKFWNCVLDDNNWNITDGAWDALTAVEVDAGKIYFFNCQISGVGRGIFSSSVGETWFTGEINVASKAFANHGGTMHGRGFFKSTGAATSGAATISVAAGTVYIDGDIIRTNDTGAPGIYNAGGTVYAEGSIDSGGQGLQNGVTAPAVASLTVYTGSINATGGYGITTGASGAEIRMSGTINASANHGIVNTGGTITFAGIVKTPSGSSLIDGINVSAGTTYFTGSVDTGGSGLTQTAGTTWINGTLRCASGNAAIGISAGTLYLDGRIDCGFHAIVPGTATAKTINIGTLQITINSGNTARRGINYAAATNCTINANVLNVQVVAGATASISTNGGNTQTITAAKYTSNVAPGADITVSAWTSSLP